MNTDISNAINTIDRLIPVVEEAESKFKSARNWSILDVLGGGTIVDLVKHYKLNKAKDLMEEANGLLQELNQQLGRIAIPAQYQMQMSGFLTFADFFFDGIFADAYMASKIMSSLDEVRRLKNKLINLKHQLQTIN